MDFTLTPEQQAFQEHVRSWIKANIPEEWSKAVVSGPPVSRTDVSGFLRGWQRKLYEAGFAGLTWPKEYGGQGRTAFEEVIFNDEMVLANAPPQINILGIGLAGPAIIALGTEQQKKRYLSRILTAEDIWCQGFSEPNAGSDLAALQTRAVREGDYFIVNGQKVWTTLAQVADRMMLLARTDPAAPKHKGITYFLLDMHLPGITVRPLQQLTGDAEFNEVFFENVRVPAEDVLGGMNSGWQAAMTTLMYERLVLGFGVQIRLRRSLEDLIGLARRTKRNGSPASRDPVVRQQLAQLWIDSQALKYTGLRALTKLLRGEMPGPEASTGKIWWCETHQRLQSLAMDLQGPYHQLTQDSPYAIDGGLWQHTFLRSLGNSLEGGTNEIQRNIVAERVLGLPKG